MVYIRHQVVIHVGYDIIDHLAPVIVSPVRSTYGGYYGLVVVTPPRPRPHIIVYAIT